MIIEDEELRSLYQVASSEHLANLEAGLLFLEKQPQDRGKLEELLRIAHSLKGDSRMLGVKDAETLTHHLEDILSSVHKGKIVFSAAIFQTLFAALDGIKRIAREATTGEPSQVSVFHLAAEMMAVLEDTEPDTPELFEWQESQATEGNLDALLALAQASLPPEPEPEVKPIVAYSEPEQNLDTIRIELAKLDNLLQYTGELITTQRRLSHQLDLITKLNSLWEDATREQRDKLKVSLDSMGQLLPQLHNNLANNNDRLKVISEGLEKDIRNLQLLPFSTLFNLFPRTVRDIAKSQNKDVNFVITSGDNLVDRKILEEIKAPLMHLLRNAVDHGLETPAERTKQGKSPQGNLRLKASVQGEQITIEVADDGRGLNLETIGASAVSKGLITPVELATMSQEEIQQLIFRPGFSTKTEVSEISGRGVGLDVVKNTIDRLQGEIKIDSHFGLGTTFRLILRANRSVIPVLIVSSNDNFYALPSDSVVTSRLVEPTEIFTLEDKPVIIWQDQPVVISFLADLLNHPKPKVAKKYACVILQINDKLQGLVVTEITAYQEIQIKPHIFPIPQLLGVTMLEDGSICQVLNPLALADQTSTFSLPAVQTPAKLLLVEDSIPIRTQLRRILEGEGYIVTTAVDGADGLQKFRQDSFDAIVSDVEMPNFSGIEMTERIRASHPTIPIVLVTTLAKSTDRERGAKAGANAYLTKGEFDQSLLLNTLRRLIP